MINHIIYCLKVFYFICVIIFLLLTSPQNIIFAEWEKYSANPVLKNGNAGEWDSGGAISSSITFNGSEYKMWYSATNGSHWQIGYATSNDGINWTKSPLNPIISPNSSLDGEIDVKDPYVIFDGTTYKMWYTSERAYTTGGNEVYRIAYTSSSRPDNWPVGQLVLRAIANTWESEGVAQPSVLKNGITYKLWYAARDGGGNWNIGFADSTDGIDWHRNSTNPILSANQPWEYSHIAGPRGIIVNNNIYNLWYHSGPIVPYNINYANSENGLTNWQKPSNVNPILTRGIGSSFDNTYLANPFVLQHGDYYRMWYSGFNGLYWQIGLASNGPLPSPTPTPSNTSTPTPTFTSTPTPTSSATPTPTPSPILPNVTTNKIVFIPGFGSTGTVKQLKNCQPTDGSDAWTLNPMGEAVYKNLLQSLTTAGYTIIPFYYDWRKTPYQLAPFVSSRINTNLEPNEKVHVLAHSYGGLVGRAYVEQTQNDSNIDAMLTVGTPHSGMVGSYLIWEGGEIPGWITHDLRLRFGVEIVKHFCPIKNRTNTIDAIHTYAPSLQRLLPTFDYLRKPYSYIFKPTTSLFWQNGWLPNNLFITPFYGIRFGTFAGTGKQTLWNLIVQNPIGLDSLRDLWTDGKPIERLFSQLGDDTVLVTSAQIPGADNRTLPLSHSGLVSTYQGIDAILNYFGTASQAMAFNALTAAEENSAVIFMSDTAVFDIENTDGTKTPDTGGMIAIINPKNGVRRMNIRPKTNTSQLTVLQLFKDGRTLWKEYNFSGRNTIQKRTFRYDEANPIENPLN